MIHTTQGDLLKQRSDAIVNAVNCVGVMGKGIALQFREAFEDNYRAYRAAFEAELLRPGVMMVHERSSPENPRWIVNFPTKRHWKGKSRIDDIASGLEDLVRVVRDLGIRSISIPPLGCGLGGLDWNVVKPMIETAFLSLPDVEVYLFEPE